MNLARRLKPYQVAHQLIHRLEPYDVSIPHLSVFRGQSFPSLRIWALLLDDEPGPVYDSAGIPLGWNVDEKHPIPEEWFGRVEV